MSWSALLLALALLIGGHSARAGRRLDPARAVPLPRRPGSDLSRDPLAVASSLDVFAACLTSGMAVATAAAATGPSAPDPLAGVLIRAADLLTLGADPVTAWSDPGRPADQRIAALLRLARRSASSGTALAQGVAELAEQSRLDAGDAAQAAAERASVLIAGPLGLCYLPAFLCLGIVPVVVGLAGDVLRSGVW
ncbi:type II secretion system F family protein [Mycolicibacterium sp. P9-64]|uniref:type II secretion system F family protein n=1 Tax=Mycolicibacterium sp. P9-64 TaxID=2024612 RepID=UPI0011F065E3|nr:type II secretion system F family protein [Mycolicibacterium sp. P9-64]KAA0085712.1 type II secretion system F family protein [Mycolicibacterium sp. P9-64]